MLRLFVAIDLPEPVRQGLAALAGGIPGAAWEPAENLHLTLRFIGNVGEVEATAMHEELERIRAGAFAFDIAGVDVFGTGEKVRTLWAGVAPAPPLRELRDRVDAALRRAGAEPEKRRYVPHVTLARLNHASPERLGAFLSAKALVRFRVEVDRFALFSSWQGRGGSSYRIEAEYPLTP